VPSFTTMTRHELLAAISLDIVRYQDASAQFDDAAAQVLALERTDLQCVSMLLFGGPASAERLRVALRLTVRGYQAMRERLELAGYARRLPDEQLELTEHARQWVGTIWGPIEEEGRVALGRLPTRELTVLARFLAVVRPMQDAHAQRLQRLLEVPGATPRSNRLRGGLSPAALRRVQLFVEANLERPLPVAALAERTGLSAFHFARAFKTSTGRTPRAFVEARRVERARALLRESERSLVQIAIDTGFGTQSRFTTTFRRATGFTPARYRRGG
jgi:AraC family transcriptional regulator